jgi:hypothetical protein
VAVVLDRGCNVSRWLFFDSDHVAAQENMGRDNWRLHGLFLQRDYLLAPALSPSQPSQIPGVEFYDEPQIAAATGR